MPSSTRKDQLELPLASKLERDPGCTMCPLHKTAEYVCLLGSGKVPSKAMVVGEAPGHREDDSGTPFVGKAGKLLDKLLAEVGLSRKDLYITNAVHCRPPDNRTPTKKEIKTCKKWLDDEINAVKPNVILLLGNTPLESVLGVKGIKQKRGKPIKRGSTLYLPAFHPAYALRDPRAEPLLKADLQVFKSLIEFGGIPQEKRLNIRLALDDEDVDHMIEDILDNNWVSHDLETTGLYAWASDAEITSFGIGTRKYQWILPLSHRESPWTDEPYKKRQAVVQRIVAAIKQNKIKSVTHNGKFDSNWLRECYEIDWRPDFDTMLAHHLLDENAGHSLKDLATIFCNAPNYDIDSNDKRGNATLEDLARYHAHDLFYTRLLRIIFQKMLDKDEALNDLMHKIVVPCQQVFIDIEKEGVYVNPQAHKKAKDILHTRLEESEKKLSKYAPGLNWASTKQVGELMFDKLGLTPLDLTKTGKASTSESVLKRLAHEHEIPKELMNFREIKQQLSFFVDGWDSWLVNSRLHPSFKLHGTVTGRLSCEDPNLQQVPRDPFIRTLIQAPEGWELVDADLSQIELRIAAEMSGEPTMLHAFQTGEDLHWKTVMRELSRSGGYRKDVLETGEALLRTKRPSYSAAIEAMLKAGPDACIEIMKAWKERRKKAKAVNFGFLYGMWWKKFIIYARDNYDVIVSEEEAQQAREDFFDLYPGLTTWHNRQKKLARQNGYVRSLSGRIRRLPAAQRQPSGHYDYDHEEALRQAINSPVQSYASEHNIMALIELYQTLDSSFYRPIGTVHDSNLMYIRKDKLKACIPIIKKTMSHPKLMDELGINISVPIEADVSIGPWGAGKSEKKYFQAA